MYYTNSRWKKFKNWLFNSHSKIYLAMMLVLLIVIAVAIRNIGAIYNIVDQEETTVLASEASTESSTIYVPPNNSYMLRVNKAANFITVYKMDAEGSFDHVFKTFRCSVNDTVELGSMAIYEKYIWRRFDSGGYGQYTSRIGSNCYIHSVPYYSESTNALNVAAYNNLGNTAKLGYIYLASADAKWIYENCGLDTKVEVYSDAAERPAIALEEFETAAANARFDPTDVSATLKPVTTKIRYMTGVKDASIAVGSVYNMWQGVYAVDEAGNDITENITITGSVNTMVPGTYTLIYNLTDTFGTNLAYYSYVTVYENRGNNQTPTTSPVETQAPTTETQAPATVPQVPTIPAETQAPAVVTQASIQIP